MRTYFLASTEAGVQQEFWNPRVEVVSSVNDPIDVLFVPPTSPGINSTQITLSGTGTASVQALSYNGTGVSEAVTEVFQLVSPSTSGIAAPVGFQIFTPLN
jgi:hypothetical protein